MSDPLCLLQVHAHPDDEASKGAATNALYAAQGIRTVLVCCTGGEAGEILNPKADTPEARENLKAVRERELAGSVEELGYDEVFMLGYRDSGMPDTEFNADPAAFTNADFAEAVGRLVEIIRTERPQVIITYGEDQSGYPHPDHIRCHEISLAAFTAAGDPSRYSGAPWTPSKLYYVGFSYRALKATADAIERLGRDGSFYAARLKDWDQSSDAAFKTQIDVTGYIGHRSRALLSHATQVDPESFWFVLSDEERQEAYPYEDYILARSSVGEPTDGFETDLFAGLR